VVDDDERIDDEDRLDLDAFSDLGFDDEDEAEEEARHRRARGTVPSWQDAISDIVARNMATRQKHGGSRRPRGRGGRRPGSK
jgi:hypothetical protein